MKNRGHFERQIQHEESCCLIHPQSVVFLIQSIKGGNILVQFLP